MPAKSTEGGYEPWQMAEIQKKRMLEQAQAIEGGAEVTPEGQVLYTPEQIQKAQEEEVKKALLEFVSKKLGYFNDFSLDQLEKIKNVILELEKIFYMQRHKDILIKEGFKYGGVDTIEKITDIILYPEEHLTAEEFSNIVKVKQALEKGDIEGAKTIVREGLFVRVLPPRRKIREENKK